jgi:hypothetical protein
MQGCLGDSCSRVLGLADMDPKMMSFWASSKIDSPMLAPKIASIQGPSPSKQRDRSLSIVI